MCLIKKNYLLIPWGSINSFSISCWESTLLSFKSWILFILSVIGINLVFKLFLLKGCLNSYGGCSSLNATSSLLIDDPHFCLI